MKQLEVHNLKKSYGKSEILRDISFEMEQGEFVAIMGQSGCGKSTLLYCLSGMDQPSFGEVFFEGRKIQSLSPKEIERLRLKRMGFIFQKPNFLRNLSLRDNILFPAFQLQEKKRNEIQKEAQSLMKQLNILEVGFHDIGEVSGGQLQRAALCRALINNPDILFGDEPTGALNSSMTQEVLDILTRIHQEGTAILLVTHDAKVALRAQRIIYLEDGRIQDILKLGSFSFQDHLKREEKLRAWLEKMKF